MRGHALAALLAFAWTLPLAAAELSCRFTPDDEARFILRQEGGGRASFANETLVLDLSAPRADKQAAAELRPLLKLPLHLQWEQQLTRDSDHCYNTGACLSDLTGKVLRIGIGGKPSGDRLLFAGRTSPQAIDLQLVGVRGQGLGDGNGHAGLRGGGDEACRRQQEQGCQGGCLHGRVLSSHWLSGRPRS